MSHAIPSQPNPSTASVLTVAVIIRTQNRPQMLKRCLQSLLAQRRQPDEVVVVNDGGEALYQLLSQFSRLKIHLIENPQSLGRAPAGNQGVEASKAQAIAFLDDDDRFLPDHLYYLSQAMQQFDAKVAYAGCRLVQRQLQAADKPEAVIEYDLGVFNDPFDAHRLRYENYIPLNSLLINRDLWNRCQGFDPEFNMFEDWDLLLRLSQRTPFYHVSRITAEYAVWGAGQITQSQSTQHWQHAYQQFIAKHIQPLKGEKQTELLARYWVVSQERRGSVQSLQQEAVSLKHDSARWQQQYLEQQSRLDALEKQHFDLKQQINEREKHIIALQNNLADRQQHNQQWQEAMAEVQKQREAERKRYEAEQKRYEAEQKRYEAERKRYEAEQKRVVELTTECAQWKQHNALLYNENQSLQQNRHELSQQLAAGLSRSALEHILLSNPIAYACHAQPIDQQNDYHRLADWVEQRLAMEKQVPLADWEQNSQSLLADMQALIDLLAASRWPQVRRYIGSVTQMQEKLRQYQRQGARTTRLATPATATPPTSTTVHRELYPTFASFAHGEMMESVREFGQTLFYLEAGQSLQFTIASSLNGFNRVDLLLATRLRINFCHLRLRLHQLDHDACVRESHVDGLRVLDNRFQPFEFEAIDDSAGKNYCLELDSPDADNDSMLAVWCHSRQAVTQVHQTINEPQLQYAPQSLPVWVQYGLADLPLAFAKTDAFDHLLLIQGIRWNTPQLTLHVLLNRLGQMLSAQNMTAKVWVQGDINGEMSLYLSQHAINVCPAADSLGALAWAQTFNAQLWLLHIDVMPQAQSFAMAQQIFAQNPQAAMLVPQERLADNRIRAGYALALRDGSLKHLPLHQPADHPYHGYLRAISAGSSQLGIVRANTLKNIDLTALADYQTLEYQISDLIGQLAVQQRQTLYCAAVAYDSQQPPLTFTDSTADQARFYQRWQQHTPQHLADFTPLAALLNPQQQPTALIIDATLPTYDEDSGSLRLFTLLKIWRNLGYKLSFIADNRDSNPKYRHALEALGIEVFHGVYNLQDAFAYRQFDIAFICRVEVGQRYIPFVRLVSPQTQIFYDTVDIHYVREQRQAEIENNPALAKQAALTRRKELALCRAADVVLTVTDDDGQHLKQAVPFLDYAVIPNVHQREPASAGFAEREGLVFIGNYNHPPNEDAMFAFIKDVLPLIQQKIPDIALYLIGSHMKPPMRALASETVHCVGWVDKVAPEFAKRRVFVSYLRYGAGMKGKIGQALALGLPVVSTSIGAEGMGLVDGKTALISDDPQGFADAVCRLYQNEALWQKLSHRGRDYIEATYGETAMQQRLMALLKRAKG